MSLSQTLRLNLQMDVTTVEEKITVQGGARTSYDSGTPFTVSDSANVALQADSPPISGFPASRPNLPPSSG